MMGYGHGDNCSFIATLSGAQAMSAGEDSGVIFDSLFRLSQLMNALSKRMETEIGLTWHQLMAIKVVGETAPKTVSNLAAKMNLHPASMGSLLDRLETRGVIKRSRDRFDRRIVHIALTVKGQEIRTLIPELTMRHFIAEASTAFPAGLAWHPEALEQNILIAAQSPSGLSPSATSEAAENEGTPEANRAGMTVIQPINLRQG